jgi:hypothetical protein
VLDAIAAMKRAPAASSSATVKLVHPSVPDVKEASTTWLVSRIECRSRSARCIERQISSMIDR